MFRLRKKEPPFGSRDHPIYEALYSEGAVPVVDGICEVKLPESRQYLVNMGYADMAEEPAPKPKGRR